RQPSVAGAAERAIGVHGAHSAAHVQEAAREIAAGRHIQVAATELQPFAVRAERLALYRCGAEVERVPAAHEAHVATAERTDVPLERREIDAPVGFADTVFVEHDTARLPVRGGLRRDGAHDVAARTDAHAATAVGRRDDAGVVDDRVHARNEPATGV